MSKEKNRLILPYIYFLVWPIFSLIFSFLNYRSKYFKNIVLLTCGFFGSTFYLNSKRNDAHYYRDLLSNYYNNRDISFFDFTKYLFSDNSHFEDQLYPLFNFIVSRFTDNFYILYTILGLIFGYLLSRNLDFIISKTNGKINKNAIWFLILIFFLAPIWNLYNVRFWITVHFFFFFAIRYLYSKNIKLLLLSLLSITMHFSFIFPCGLLVLYHFLGNRYWIYMFIFIISFIFLNIELNDILKFLPKDIGYADSKIVAYTADDYVKTAVKNSDNRIWIVKIRTNLLVYMNLIFIFILFLFFRRRLIENEFTKSLFSFAILFFAASSFLIVIPTMDRFVIVSSMFLATFYFLVIQNYTFSKSAKSLMLFFNIPIILYCVVEMRIGLEFISTDMIFLNPLISWFFPHDVSLLELVK
jgi:hypothetical protein